MNIIKGDKDCKDGTSPKAAPLKRILHFVNSGLPLGMGLLKSGNFLYIFGGEYLSDFPCYKARLRRRLRLAFRTLRKTRGMVCGIGIPEENPPCPVFSLDLTSDHSEPVPLRSMLGPKIYPVVGDYMFFQTGPCLVCVCLKVGTPSMRNGVPCQSHSFPRAPKLRSIAFVGGILFAPLGLPFFTVSVPFLIHGSP